MRTLNSKEIHTQVLDKSHSLFLYSLIVMTDMSYNIKCTFAEIFIFIRAIVQKYNLVHIVRVLVEGQYRL